MEANRKQAAKDWEINLTHRAAELKSGGYLVATVPTYTPGASYLRLLSWAYASWKSISNKLTEEEFRTFFIGIWHRSREELLAPMAEGSALHKTFEVVEARLDDITSPPWLMYQQDKDAGKLALNYANYCMAIGGGLLQDHLRRRPPAEIESIVKAFHAGVIAAAAADVQEIKMPIGLLVLKKL
ncbi:hypothetical protein WJX74_008717 [Apatococcus lobatus]|uniref:Uncharacterized protein n=1 Tax=Apatococcus lobatus TaxID=904363 RepID=A0AAW1QIU7_9CHLO